MATPNLAPRADGEGNLGTSLKAWLSGFFKTLNVLGELILTQIAKPANPSAGENKLYFKSDGNLYKLDSAGNEVQVDSAGSADMEKSVYDTDDNGIVDKAEILNDGSTGGGNEVTASEARTHIDDTSNPHSVTKTQVGLGNVPDLNTTDAVANEHTHANKAELDLVSDGDHDVRSDNPHSVTKSQVGLSNVDDLQQLPLSYLDTDDALTADSDVKVPSQSAVKSYIDALLGANDAMVFKGVIDCSTNPDYPSADAGHTYRISVAGKIGGASGVNVEVGDIVICITDSTSSGDQVTVGSNWNIIQVNIDGAVVAVSPFSSVDDNIPKYSGTSGRVIEDSGVPISDITGHIADNNNPHNVQATQVPTDNSGENVQSKLDSIDTDISDLKTSNITFIIDGGGSEITTGIKGDIQAPFGCTITKATLLADQSGSIVVDIWKDTYANYPATDTDSITASAPPTISGATKSQDSTLTGWTTSISNGDILRYNVDSVTTIQRVTLILEITRT